MFSPGTGPSLVTAFQLHLLVTGRLTPLQMTAPCARRTVTMARRPRRSFAHTLGSCLQPAMINYSIVSSAGGGTGRRGKPQRVHVCFIQSGEQRLEEEDR